MRLDASGKACPIPVIMTKKELEAGTADLETLVDSDTQVKNLERLANSQGRTTTVTPEGDKFVVSFSNGDGSAPSAPTEKETFTSDGTYAVFFNNASVGTTNELGKSLAKMAIYTLSESDNIPTYILFMNEGINLVTGTEQQIIDNLNTLIEKGTEVLVCGTCLNFFDIADKCKVGTVSNMYDIMTAMQSVSKVITL